MEEREYLVIDIPIPENWKVLIMTEAYIAKDSGLTPVIRIGILRERGNCSINFTLQQIRFIWQQIKLIINK